MPSFPVYLRQPLTIAQRSIAAQRVAELERLSSVASGISLSTPARGCPIKLLRACPADPTLTNGKFLCLRAADGNKLRTSCALAGLTTTTVNNWLREGKSLAIAIDGGEMRIAELRDNSPHYYEFYLDYRAAEAQHIAPLEAETIRAALRGTVVTTTHEELVKDPLTGHVIETKTVIGREQTTRDGQAALKLLQIHDPATYSPPKEVRVTGSGTDGAIAIETTHSFSALLKFAKPDELSGLLTTIDVLMQRAAEHDKQAAQRIIPATTEEI